MLSRRQFTHTALTAAAATLLPIHARSQAAYGIPFRFSLMLGTLSKSAPAFEDRLAIAAKAGYQGIEFVGEWTKWTDADYARVVPQIQSAHLTVDSMAGTGITFSDPKGVEDLEPRMAHAIAAADKLDCPQLLLTSGKRFEGSTTQVCVDNLKRILALAERAHKNVVIEPIDTLENPTIYLTGVTEAFDICRQVGSSSLKVLYDVYHEQRQAGNLLEKFQNNIDLVGLVHIADVPGRHEPGTGEIRYDQIFRLLAHLNYKGFVAMEYHALGDPFQTLVKVREDAIAAAKS